MARTRRKKDPAEKETDEILDELESRIVEIYSQAQKDLQEKFERHVEKFAEKDELMRQKVKDGKMKEEEYLNWRKGQFFIENRLDQLIKELGEDLVNANQIATSISNGYMPDAYALNFNYETYDIEQNTQVDTSFTLYSRESVERLVKEKEITLPKRKVDVPKDQKWNVQHLNNEITQGILQGKSIPDISKSLRNVTDMNRKASIRNARTMMTGAQNGGRMDAYARADSLGIKIQKEWMATLDSRTRDSHQEMDGKRVDWKKPFENGLMYPGDPSGDPSEVYNCRCTMVPFYPDYADITDKRITYKEWASNKQDEQNQQNEKKAFDRSKIQHSDGATRLINTFENSNVEYKEVNLWDQQPSEEEIIERLAGGDLTKGSCMSLACAYAGNKNGLDVIDFRGGSSCNIMSLAHYNLLNMDIFRSNSSVVTGNSVKPAKSLLKQVQKGKEYIFITGRHAAVVRLNDENNLQYLELQSASNNGWKNFEYDYIMYKGYAGWERPAHHTISDTLNRRFGCAGASASYGMSSLTDISGLKDYDEFREILGYVNTDPDKQKKGQGGSAK